MNEIVKVTIPVNELMELLRREAELESIKNILKLKWQQTQQNILIKA